MIKGVVVAPKLPTCHSSIYDYFIVSESLVPAIAGIARVENAGLFPRWPARLFIRGDARRFRTRQLVRPTRVQAVLPYGPLPDPEDPSKAMPQSVDDASIDQAAEAWLKMSYREWSSLTGLPLVHRAPVFRWQPAAGCTADQYAGACAKSGLWRSAARRFTEIGMIIDRRHPGSCGIIGDHFAAMCSAPLVGFDSNEKTAMATLLQEASTAARDLNSVALRRLAAIAIKEARRVEEKVRHKKAADWRRALKAPSDKPHAGPAPPSRLAYAWLRGTACWTKSPIGQQWRNDEIPDGELFDDCPEYLVEPALNARRVWQQPCDTTEAVLCDQADVDMEADSWAQLWLEGAGLHSGL